MIGPYLTYLQICPISTTTEEVIPANGWVCELVPVDGLTASVQLLNRFVAASSQVTIDGLHQYRGASLDYIEHPLDGLIEFSTPPDSGSVVLVCYEAIGRVD